MFHYVRNYPWACWFRLNELVLSANLSSQLEACSLAARETLRPITKWPQLQTVDLIKLLQHLPQSKHSQSILLKSLLSDSSSDLQAPKWAEAAFPNCDGYRQKLFWRFLWLDYCWLCCYGRIWLLRWERGDDLASI